MRTAAHSQEKSRAARRLEELRMRVACKVHKHEGDAEEIREDGLRTYKALEPARKRANESSK